MAARIPESSDLRPQAGDSALGMAGSFLKTRGCDNLLQGHTSSSFPNSCTNWGPSIQLYEPLVDNLFQITTAANYRKNYLEIKCMLESWGLAVDCIYSYKNVNLEL